MKPAIVTDIKNAEENPILKRIINIEGIINIDSKDIQAVLGKKALYGSGEATGFEKIRRATRDAIASILLADTNAFEVDRAVLNIAVGTGTEIRLLMTFYGCVNVVESFLEPDPDLRFGLIEDDSLRKVMWSSKNRHKVKLLKNE